jgi:hypothetical protein
MTLSLAIILVLFVLLADLRIKSTLYYDQKRLIVLFGGLRSGYMTIGILLFFLTTNLSQLPIAETTPIPPPQQPIRSSDGKKMFVKVNIKE